jgi:hypothetical protein
VTPVNEILALEGEFVSDIVSVPVPPLIAYRGDLNTTPFEVSILEVPNNEGGGETTIVIIIEVVALAVSVAVTVS